MDVYLEVSVGRSTEPHVLGYSGVILKLVYGVIDNLVSIRRQAYELSGVHRQLDIVLSGKRPQLRQGGTQV
jgi:hypothetical protein